MGNESGSLKVSIDAGDVIVRIEGQGETRMTPEQAKDAAWWLWSIANIAEESPR